MNEIVIKKCNRCNTQKSVEYFYKNKSCKDGYSHICKTCQDILNKYYIDKHPERHQEWRERKTKYGKENYRKYREQKILRHKIVCKNNKKKVFDFYGDKCACCGEKNIEFLAIDHINGGGNKHRKGKGDRSLIYLVREEGYPKDRYRLLCSNCNHSLGARGYCPHQRDRDEQAVHSN